MKTIYKYELTVDGTNAIALPGYGNKILSVGNQRGNVCIWIEQDTPDSLSRYTGKPHILKERHFKIIGTGHGVQNNLEFIGTVIVEPFVWHVYEITNTVR